VNFGGITKVPSVGESQCHLVTVCIAIRTINWFECPFSLCKTAHVVPVSYLVFKNGKHTISYSNIMLNTSLVILVSSPMVISNIQICRNILSSTMPPTTIYGPYHIARITAETNEKLEAYGRACPALRNYSDIGTPVCGITGIRSSRKSDWDRAPGILSVSTCDKLGSAS
jgi:hypothetical protein